MKYRLLTFLVLLILLPIPLNVSLAGFLSGEPIDEPYYGAVLCLPERFKASQVGCVKLGPVAYLSRMAGLGIIFPLQPLHASPPDPNLTTVDLRYGKVVTPNASVYASLEDAVKKKAVIRKIDSNYSFISYIDEAIVDGKRYYMIEYGGWMTANDVSRIGYPPLFQGLELNHLPARPFGWILFQIQTKSTPGFQISDYTGNELYRYEVVQVYAAKFVDGMEWYMVAPDEWIPEKQEWLRTIGRVIPNPTPPVGVDNGRWIEVNLYDQTLSVYDNNRLVYATLVASGIEPFWTRPGLFKIYQKLEKTLMRGAFEPDLSDAYYLEDVPWTMYYDKARALHGAYWHNSYGWPRSHGCVNLSVGDAHWIFNWANENEWVYVWDPSGKTPTDPALYGEGGA